MNRRLFLFLLALWFQLDRAAAAEMPAAAPAAAAPKSVAPAAPAAGASATPTTAPASTARNVPPAAPTTTFEAFRVIPDRNIFNANRTGRRERVPEEAQPRVDLITLVGTMNSERGLRAFFEGSDAAYRKALFVGGTVETFKVTKITAQSVELDREGKTFSVRVGQQLRRLEGGDWSVLGEELARVETRSRPGAGAEPVAIPSDASDTLRKMMEARQKQLKP